MKRKKPLSPRPMPIVHQRGPYVDSYRPTTMFDPMTGRPTMAIHHDERMMPMNGGGYGAFYPEMNVRRKHRGGRKERERKEKASMCSFLSL